MEGNKSYFLFTTTVFISLLIPILVQDGMFLDGVTYSAISKNMANGLGYIWEPHYTKVLYPIFHEHPPLVFYIESLFFKIFGNAFYTERIYSLTTAILSLIGISKCWKLFYEKNEHKQNDWFPILIWLTVPIVSWSYKNNMLENTVAVFTIFAVFFILKSLIEERIVYILIGAILTLSAFLSKGMVGLFPLAVPLTYGIIYSKKRVSLVYFVCLISAVALLYFSLSIAFPELNNNIKIYFEQQLIPALDGKREITTDNKFAILIDLLKEMALPVLLFLFFVVKVIIKEKRNGFFNNKAALFFLLTALSASIPLIVTLKQRKFYLVPSIPFYVLSVCFWIYPYVKSAIDKTTTTFLMWLNRISILTLSIVLVFSIFRFGKFSRDQNELNDVYAVSQVLPEGTVIATTKNLWSDWGLVAYMSRVGYLSLDCDNLHEYYLVANSDTVDKEVLEQYYKLNLNLKKFALLKRKSSN